MKYIFFVCLMFSLSCFSYAAELDDRKDIENKVGFLFLTEGFNELGALSKVYLESKERTSSGLWKLTLFYVGIGNISDQNSRDEKYWDKLEDKAKRWILLQPNSPSSHVTYAQILIDRAWMYRGGGWASTVREEDWKPFRDQLLKAKSYLVKNKAIASKDPHWYELMLIICKSEGWSEVEFEVFVEEAISLYPDFYQIYFASVDYLTPKWHGNKEKIEAFANKSVEKTKFFENTGMYARVYWYASQENYGDKLFTESSVVWPKMSRAIDDVLAKYPDQWNINNFAYFSCLAKDKHKTKILINKVEVEPILKVWKTMRFYEYCKEWANN